MTLTLPAGPVGKMLAIASGLLALAILYLVVIAPLLGLYQSQTQELQLRAERAEYLRHAADTLPQLKEAAGRLALRNKSSGGLLLAEPSDAFAAATIQSTVKAMVTEDGGNLASVDTMQVQSVKGMRRVGIRVSFSASLSVLAGVLKKIEASRPALFIDNFDVHTSSSTGTNDQAQPLTVALDIYGFRS